MGSSVVVCSKCVVQVVVQASGAPDVGDSVVVVLAGQRLAGSVVSATETAGGDQCRLGVELVDGVGLECEQGPEDVSAPAIPVPPTVQPAPVVANVPAMAPVPTAVQPVPVVQQPRLAVATEGVDGPCWLKHSSGRVQGMLPGRPYHNKAAAEKARQSMCSSASWCLPQWTVVMDAGRVVGVK